MTSALLALICVIVAGFVLRAPIGFSMIVSGIAYLAVKGQDVGLVAEQILNGLYNSYVLLAVPLELPDELALICATSALVDDAVDEVVVVMVVLRPGVSLSPGPSAASSAAGTWRCSSPRRCSGRNARRRSC